MNEKYLKIETNEQTRIISINRPEVYNALNKEAKIEIIKAIREANRDQEIRSIVLSAEGKAFCSGQDLNDRSVDGSTGPVDLGETLETEWNPLVMSIRNSKKLIIAAINGVAAGAGLSVAMACDMVISKPGVKFVSGFGQLGLAPDAGSSYTFVRALGEKKALEFFLLGKPLLAEELEKAQLINSISENYLEDALSLCAHINKMAPLSIEMIKKNLQNAGSSSFSQSMQRETETQRFLGASSDYQEGLRAFFEKRPPQFKGL